MLFDLSSPGRKRVIQVVYATLALLMGGSLVLFGIGSDAPGGILDAVGLGGDDSGGSGSPQYEQQIEAAEARLETNPNDPAALLSLVNYHYLSATTQGGGIETDVTTGQVTVTEQGRSELEATVDAWQRYLATKPDRANTKAASSAAQAYRFLNDAGGAAEAQEVVAAAQDTPQAFYELAFFHYADFNFKAGDTASEKAVAAAEPADRKRLEKDLADLADRARAERKAIEKAREQGDGAGGQAELDDPFGALGSGGAAGQVPVPTTPGG